MMCLCASITCSAEFRSIRWKPTMREAVSAPSRIWMSSQKDSVNSRLIDSNTIQRRLSQYPFDLELCDLCVRTCPIKNAISMETVVENGVSIKTPVVHEACVGCGVCEMVCPPDLAAIVVEARKGWSV